MRRLAILLVFAAALAAPADALAVDHVWLTLKGAKLGDGWTLTGASTSPDWYANGKEILGVTFNRRRSAVADERHALRAHLLRATVSFDGQRGRWRALRVNGVFDVDMTIEATGEAQEVAEALGCRGPLKRVPVALRGTFVVRTGTEALKTVRRTRLAGLVTYNDGGQLGCEPVAGGCANEEWLTASNGQRRLSVLLTQRTMALSFPEAGGWYHVLERRQLIVSGALPTIRVAASGLGAVTFTATSTVEAGEACRLVTAEGSMTGSFIVKFAAWGTRTFRAASADYRQYRPA